MGGYTSPLPIGGKSSYTPPYLTPLRSMRLAWGGIRGGILYSPLDYCALPVGNSERKSCLTFSAELAHFSNSIRRVSVCRLR
jgi:hypothetical protein